MTTITLEDQKRLAHIRAEMEKWEALNPEAKDWDSAFLLKLLDGKKTKKEITMKDPKCEKERIRNQSEDEFAAEQNEGLDDDRKSD